MAVKLCQSWPLFSNMQTSGFHMTRLKCEYFKENGFSSWKNVINCIKLAEYEFVTTLIEPRREKTGLRGFRPGLTRTDLYSHRSGLEA